MTTCARTFLRVGWVLPWWIWLLIALAVTAILIPFVTMMYKNRSKDIEPMEVPDTAHMVLDDYGDDQYEVQDADIQIFEMHNSDA